MISIWKTTILQHGDQFSFDSSTFLQHWCPENIVKQRFHYQNVRQFNVFATLMSGKHCKTTISQPKCATCQFYVFATLMSGKHYKTTISRPTCATVLRFCNTDVRNTLQNNDFTKFSFDSSAFSQHWCPENTVKQRFHKVFVRQF